MQTPNKYPPGGYIEIQSQRTDAFDILMWMYVIPCCTLVVLAMLAFIAAIVGAATWPLWFALWVLR